MTRLDVNVARCEALFASGLQRRDGPRSHAVGPPTGGRGKMAVRPFLPGYSPASHRQCPARRLTS